MFHCKGSNMKLSSYFAAAILSFAAVFCVGAFAQAATSPATSGDTKAMPAGSSELSEGEVRKVDKDNKKITLRHGEIKNLSMPGMTMVFGVKDPAMLDAVKTGDKVKFTADKMNGALTVMTIEQAK